MEPKFKTIAREELDLWEDANVRKSEVLTNIADLAGSIRKNGLCVPLLVTPKRGGYLVFSGQRRLIASKAARLQKIPCFIFKNIELTDARLLSLSENLYREAMTRDDRSNAAKVLFEKFKSIDSVARALGVKAGTVKGYLTYDAIPDELKKFARGGGLSPKQVEDIYIKFPDIDRAVLIATRLSKIRDRTKKIKMHAAIRQSAPSDDVAMVERRAEKLLRMKTYKIILPDNDYKMIEKVAHIRRIGEEDLLVDIVEGWIQEYNEGGHR